MNLAINLPVSNTSSDPLGKGNEATAVDLSGSELASSAPGNSDQFALAVQRFSDTLSGSIAQLSAVPSGQPDGVTGAGNLAAREAGPEGPLKAQLGDGGLFGSEAIFGKVLPDGKELPLVVTSSQSQAGPPKQPGAEAAPVVATPVKPTALPSGDAVSLAQTSEAPQQASPLHSLAEPEPDPARAVPSAHLVAATLRLTMSAPDRANQLPAGERIQMNGPILPQHIETSAAQPLVPKVVAEPQSHRQATGVSDPVLRIEMVPAAAELSSPSSLASPKKASPSVENGPSSLLASSIQSASTVAANITQPAPATQSGTLQSAFGSPSIAGIEQAVEHISQARESARTARPEVLLKHAEFGLIAMRVDVAAGDMRATLSARDPGFVPAVQAMLAERTVAPVDETASNPQRGSEQSQSQPSQTKSQAQNSHSQNGHTKHGFSDLPQPDNPERADGPRREQALTEDGSRRAGMANNPGLFA